MRGGGSSGCTSIFLVDNILESLDGDFSQSDFQKGADEGADHVAQETVRRDGENQLVVHAVPMRLRDMADEIVDLRMYLREAGKILILK